MILFLFVCMWLIGLCLSIEIDERKEKIPCKINQNVL